VLDDDVAPREEEALLAGVIPANEEGRLSPRTPDFEDLGVSLGLADVVRADHEPVARRRLRACRRCRRGSRGRWFSGAASGLLGRPLRRLPARHGEGGVASRVDDRLPAVFPPHAIADAVRGTKDLDDLAHAAAAADGV
jgi:hypothetical protein